MVKAYIYKITNEINNKIYIGQTSRNIVERFSEHKRATSNQPLYNAMRKYGIDNFSLELVEECSQENVDEREIYYINKYDSYKNGYNATMGGEGRPTTDYVELAEDFLNSGLSITKYADRENIKEATVRNSLEATGRTEEYRKLYPEYNTRFNAVSVKMLDKKDNTLVQVFDSISKALNYLNKGKDKGHIKAVCEGKRNSAYGYKWQYA